MYCAILRDLLSGRWRQGNAVEELEAEITRRFDVPFALAMPQARVAIYLAVKTAVNRTGRRKVIMSPYTIFDVVNMVVSAGGEPVFADLEPDTCNLSAAEAEKLIDDETAAVLVTHIHGLAADIRQFRKICDGTRVLLIEDAAQAFGGRVAGRALGTSGDIGIFSFGLAKNVNSFFGGMIVTHDAALYETMYAERSTFPLIPWGRLMAQIVTGLVTDLTLHPLIFKPLSYWLFRIGYLHNIEIINKRVTVEDNPVLRREIPAHYKVRMSPSQARLVLSQLPFQEEQMKARIANGTRYFDALKEIPEIRLAPHATDGSHAYMSFGLQVADRHALVRHLMSNRRDCAVQHLKNCADLECFANWYRNCPNARRTAAETLILPTYPRYGRDEVTRTAAAVRSYFGYLDDKRS